MIDNIKDQFDIRFQSVKSLSEFESLKAEFLGKKSELNLLFSTLKQLPPEERINVATRANAMKKYIQEKISELQKKLSDKTVNSCEVTSFDNTLPGKNFPLGSLHPVTIVQKEVERLFTGMGFKILDGPEVEEDFYNFEALNIPKLHPARDMQDTYWLENNQLLRTHTSPTQIRGMLKYGAPLKAIAPGRCFRNEKLDPSHENTFYQLEGFVVDKNVSIANLIYIMKQLLNIILERDVVIRLRPGFFPFVEPGFELDMQCSICHGEGCSTCHHSGWIELVPCGMIHPNVLKHGNINPDEYSGFAFGLGLTRLAMMKYGIKDIRLFNGGDLRQLQQFK